MALKTQGTDLYFIDPENDEIVKVGCPISITGPSSTNDQIEITCLDDNTRRYMSGLATPGPLNFTIQLDTTDASHLRLLALKNAGTTIDFVIGYSDGTTTPDLDTAGDFALPTDRSWILFSGYVSDFPQTFELNSVVTVNVAVQVSGGAELVAKTT